LGETWDPDLLKQVAEVESIEAATFFRALSITRVERYSFTNADIGRDPRWEELRSVTVNDAYFNGTMVVSFVKGLQATTEVLRSAALMKHFLANSNENVSRQEHLRISMSDFFESTTRFRFAWE
jgi:beta-glucosidase